jgi:hypothetical protein
MLAGWILELDRGEGNPLERELLFLLEQKTYGWQWKKSMKANAAKPWNANWNGCACALRPVRPNQKPVFPPMRKWLNEDGRQKEEKLEIFIPNGPRLGDNVVEASGVDPRLMATSSSLKI